MTNIERLKELLIESEDLNERLIKAMKPFGFGCTEDKNLSLSALTRKGWTLVRLVKVGNQEVDRDSE
jgi:hypothetical protein